MANLNANIAMLPASVPIIGTEDGMPSIAFYSFLYGLWVRTGSGSVAVSPTGGVGYTALQSEITSLTATVNVLSTEVAQLAAVPAATPGGSSGQYQINNGGTFGGVTISGDGTIDQSGNLTVFSIGGEAVSLAGPLTTSGAFPVTATFTGPTSVVFPTSGTLAIVGTGGAGVAAITDGVNTVGSGGTMTISTGLALSAGGTLTATGGGGATLPLALSSQLYGGTGVANLATPVSLSGMTLVGGVLSPSGGVNSGGVYDITSGVPSLVSFTSINFGVNPTVAQVPSSAIVMTSTGTGIDYVYGIARAAPVAPYRIAVFIQHIEAQGNTNTIPMFGFSDGTRYHTVWLWFPGYFSVRTYSNNTTNVSSTTITGFVFSLPGEFWVGLRDDGTNVYWEVSFDGVEFIPVYSVAKAAGYLGAGGYNVNYVGINTSGLYAGTSYMTIRAWDPNGLTRTYNYSQGNWLTNSVSSLGTGLSVSSGVLTITGLGAQAVPAAGAVVSNGSLLSAATLVGITYSSGTLTARPTALAQAQWVQGATVVAGTVWLVGAAPYAGTIVSAGYLTQAGSFTAGIAINGTPVTGLGSLSVSSSTLTTTSASGSNTFSIGDVITATISSPASSPTGSLLYLNINWS